MPALEHRYRLGDYVDFNGAMREQDEKDRNAADVARSAEARHSIEAEQAVAEVKQALVDLARYLGSKSAAQYRFVHVAKGKGLLSRSKRTESPAGFALGVSSPSISAGPTEGLSALTLLTPDGRLWSFSNYGRLEPKSGWIDITRESIEKGIWLDPHTVYLRPGGGLYVPRNDDTSLAFMELMTKVATNCLARGGNYRKKGLTKIS